MKFIPEEVLFFPTAECNLSCPHCTPIRSKKKLSVKSAATFLSECKKAGIDHVGFSGGEPFLAPVFLCSVTRYAVNKGMVFDRIMTNGVWYKNKKTLDDLLEKLLREGYDGDICVSVDPYHAQDLKKLAYFIKRAVGVWKRADVVSIASVVSQKEVLTERFVSSLAKELGASFSGFSAKYPFIRNDSLFIKIYKIKLSPVGSASGLVDGWDGKWFKEDYCKGPGNVLAVMPDGDIKPCCGYANQESRLTIGNIFKDRLNKILKKADSDEFISAVFKYGLSGIRNKLVKAGIRFPRKTSDNCLFCHYIMTAVPGEILKSVLTKKRGAKK